jgi:hypothetical protein
MGGVSPVLYRLLYRLDLPKYLRPVQISARAYIFTISYEKVKNLSRLLSVLSLHRITLDLLYAESGNYEDVRDDIPREYLHNLLAEYEHM